MRGELVHMTLVDLGAEIDLERIGSLLGRKPQPAPVVSRASAPANAPFPHPREVLFHEPDAPTGTQVEIRVHALGVAAIRIRVPMTADGLEAMPAMARSVRIQGKTFQEAAAQWAQQLKPDVAGAAIEPYPALVQPESYTVYCMWDTIAEEVLAKRENLAAVIAGEVAGTLVSAVVDSALKHTLQYYKGDAVVVGWDNAVIISPEGTYEDTLDVMELANLQLVEFRTYDAYLDDRLDESFAALDRLWAPGGLFRSARHALQDISELRVDFARLTDNLHDTGKLFGEWHLAKLHTHLRDSFHLASWEKAVAGKMETLEDMFQLAEEEANHRRSLILEVLVVVLFVLDIGIIVALGV